MIAIYAIAALGSEVQDFTIQAERAASLNCQPQNGVDFAKLGISPAPACPCVVIIQDTPNATPVVIDDSSGQATLAQVQAAQQAATNAETAQASSLLTVTANLRSAIANLAPGLTQATSDAATCASSSTDIAPILGRVVNDLATVATALAGVMAVLEIIEATEVPNA